MLRRLLLSAVLAAAALALTASSAFAVVSYQGMRASMSPTKVGTAKKPRNERLTVNPFIRYDPADPPFATKTAVLWIDRDLRVNGAKLRSCTEGQVQLDKCPSGSRVGTGTATGYAPVLGVNEPLALTAYNSDRGRKLLIFAVGDSPTLIHDVIIGRISKVSGTYGTKLSVVIPVPLQLPAPNVYVVLVNFKLSVGSRTSRYVQSTACRRGGLRIKGRFAFTDGTAKSANARVKCRR